MQFLTSTPLYARDIPAKATWAKLEAALNDVEGFAYYKHPVFAVVNPNAPDLVAMGRGFEPFSVVVVPYRTQDISLTSDLQWKLTAGRIIDSPVLQVEDHVEGLRRRLALDRELRTAYKPYGILALPLISEADCNRLYPDLVEQCDSLGIVILAEDDAAEALLQRTRRGISDAIWSRTLSVLQNVSPLNKPQPTLEETNNRVGQAISRLEREIAILDNEQHRVAVEMAPGPQRIRGLAGTGKTVVLALKAANLHLQFPEKKILVTFSTQSLYNQMTSLITRFYRPYADADPNWENLHIRHSWGSSARPGVYSDICAEKGVVALTLDTARLRSHDDPFRACCDHALKIGTTPQYDYILVDEAQDFVHEFFSVLLDRATEEHCVYFAYDELQNLSAVVTPGPDEMFGLDGAGKPRVSLLGEYESGIEKDFVLHKSYRCPRQNLVLAHAIGLGIKDEKKIPAQMIDNQSSWESFGYEILEGSLKPGEPTIINRPAENSPNRIGEIYTGKYKFIDVRVAEDQKAELKQVADEIANLVQVEGVRPEHIIVTSLKARPKEMFMNLQRLLHYRNVDSSIPGLVQSAWAFGIEDKVTLSTIRRVKGNEAPIVFIVGFESLYDYVDQIENRNKAFTALSRSKGWLRISGVGSDMTRAKREIDAILADNGRLCFDFPDMEDVRIRRLDASDTSKRRKELASAQRAARQLATVDPEALAHLDPATFAELKKRLNAVPDER